MTLEEYSSLPRGGARHELNAGKLITMPLPKSRHSRVSRAVFKALDRLLEQEGTREVYMETGYLLAKEPNTLRQPDVAVMSKDQILATEDDDYFEGAPELAVEVVSPGNSDKDLNEKVRQYLGAGGRWVWVVYPETQSVTVWDTSGSRVFTGDDVLPEFALKVSELFSGSHATA